MVRLRDTPLVPRGEPLDHTPGATVVGAGAWLAGGAERSVLWPDTEVRPDERLVSAIRASDRVTVLVR